MTNKNLTATRRQALAGIALCGVAAAAPAFAVSSQPVDRRAWDQAVARYVEASQAMTRLGEQGANCSHRVRAAFGP